MNKSPEEMNEEFMKEQEAANVLPKLYVNDRFWYRLKAPKRGAGNKIQDRYVREIRENIIGVTKELQTTPRYPEWLDIRELEILEIDHLDDDGTLGIEFENEIALMETIKNIKLTEDSDAETDDRE